MPAENTIDIPLAIGNISPSIDDVAVALRESFVSPNVFDSNMEEANVVDIMHALSENTRLVAHAITYGGGGQDATGGRVECLTEAAMGITAALVRIAESIGDLASAIRERE